MVILVHVDAHVHQIIQGEGLETKRRLIGTRGIKALCLLEIERIDVFGMTIAPCGLHHRVVVATFGVETEVVIVTIHGGGADPDLDPHGDIEVHLHDEISRMICHFHIEPQVKSQTFKSWSSMKDFLGKSIHLHLLSILTFA